MLNFGFFYNLWLCFVLLHNYWASIVRPSCDFRPSFVSNIKPVFLKTVKQITANFDGKVHIHHISRHFVVVVVAAALVLVVLLVVVIQNLKFSNL